MTDDSFWWDAQIERQLIFAWEETLALQLSYLPDGPLGLFAQVRAAASEGIPPELERLYAKLKAKEIDAQDFARRAKDNWPGD